MLHQPGAQEREIAFARYDYVIQQPDVEQRRSLCDTLGEHLVLRTGRRSPRRVVVNQHQLCGEQFQRPFNNQPMVDDRSLHPALAYALVR